MIKCPICNQMEIEYRMEKRDFAGNLVTTQAPGDSIFPATATECQLWALYCQHGNDPNATINKGKLAIWIADLGYTRLIKHW